MTATFCGQCGQHALEKDVFCVGCGERLRLTREEAHTRRPAATESGDDLAALRHAVDLLAHGDHAAATVVFDRLLADQPGWAVARAYRGIAHLRAARVTEARADLEEAVRQAPESFICRSRYAEFFARLGFYDKAMVEAGAALETGAPDAESRRALMELRSFCKEHSKGLFYRETASPSSFRFRNLLPGLGRGTPGLREQQRST